MSERNFCIWENPIESTVIQKGKRSFVDNFEESLFELANEVEHMTNEQKRCPWADGDEKRR